MTDMTLLLPYKNTFENHLKASIGNLGEKSKLRDACEYALLNGGKRIRPIIVQMMAKALEKEMSVLDACLSVEFFHTASLIADDLPCMDNDDFRREKPSTHKVYGETVALLASYALITEGFEMVHKSTGELVDGDKVGMLALATATKGSGLSGATGGQFLDLFPKGKTLGNICEVIEKKTVTLFEVAFVFGWLFGGGEISGLDNVKKAAHHFGMAFQIADDLDDLKQDGMQKESQNIALCLGGDQARDLFDAELKCFESQMKKLQIFNLEFQELSRLLYAKLEQAPLL